MTSETLGTEGPRRLAKGKVLIRIRGNRQMVVPIASLRELAKGRVQGIPSISKSCPRRLMVPSMDATVLDHCKGLSTVICHSRLGVRSLQGHSAIEQLPEGGRLLVLDRTHLPRRGLYSPLSPDPEQPLPHKGRMCPSTSLPSTIRPRIPDF